MVRPHRLQLRTYWSIVVVEKPKKVGLYLRVSTAGQTVENQRAELVRVAEQRGWQIVETYIDRGVSGAKGRDKRPEFDRLCRDAAQAKIDVVAAWSIDRIGRSLHHVANFMAELADQGVALYLHQQGVDGTTSAGKAMLGMAAVFAEFERALIVERIRSGIARVRGKKRLGRPPVHANIEHRIRALRRTGYAKLRIARTLGCGVSTVQRVLAA
jgi:DNA invertase Pin-like site-specific DNA recombinase